MRAVPPHGDRGGLPDDCPHRQHSADSSHRGDLPCQGDEEQRPGQRHVQVQTLRTRSSCSVKRLLIVCRFIKNPEFVKVGAKILFREGRTKGLGKVTQVFPFEYNKEADR